MDAIEFRQENTLLVSDETVGLTRAKVSRNTLKAYRHASHKLESWLAGRVLEGRLFSDFVTGLRLEASASVIDLLVAGRWGKLKMWAHYARVVLAERAALVRFKKWEMRAMGCK